MHGIDKGKVLLDFEKTDMREAKKILGDRVCLFGNVLASLLVYGKTTEVEEYCRKLIKDCTEGGGFILATECETPWDSKCENARAMIEPAMKYGPY
jgi:uroporphyrinogen-III decarboxylase